MRSPVQLLLTHYFPNSQTATGHGPVLASSDISDISDISEILPVSRMDLTTIYAPTANLRYQVARLAATGQKRTTALLFCPRS